jgi:hypothetical protein
MQSSESGKEHWALVDMVTQLWSGNFSTSRVTIDSQGLCSMQLVQKKVSVQYNFQIVLPYSGVVINAFTWYKDDKTFWITRVTALAQWEHRMSQQSNTELT